MSSPPLVHIHYLRPPDRWEIFTQHLIHDTPEVKVTLARNVPFDPPIRILGRVALEKGSDAVWFTFPGCWHDIGRFHRADGTFTGIYANILTPVEMPRTHIWRTTDLFLDLWVPSGEKMTVLDEDQLEEALERRWVSERTASRARQEADRLTQAYQEGEWPPSIVEEWTREKALTRAKAPAEPE